MHTFPTLDRDICAIYASRKAFKCSRSSPLSNALLVYPLLPLLSSRKESCPDTKTSPYLTWQETQVGAGLDNLGNTCYINAILQCLSYLPPMAEHFLRGGYPEVGVRIHVCVLCTGLYLYLLSISFIREVGFASRYIRATVSSGSAPVYASISDGLSALNNFLVFIEGELFPPQPTHFLLMSSPPTPSSLPADDRTRVWLL